MPEFTLYEGECRAGLLSLPAGHLHTVVTSIPYYGLRAYGTEPQVWGGDPACDHVWGPEASRYNPTKHTDRGNNGKHGYSPLDVLPGEHGAWCGLCEAWRGELGSEPNPDLFVAHIVAVFRAVGHALRPDGTVWLNIGDSYTSTSSYNAPRSMHTAGDWKQPGTGPNVGSVAGLGEKNLLLMPARVALALQADGWTVRSEIIWAKPNPMPESVTDRPTKAHEQIYLLTKGPRYFYDADAIREASQNTSGWAKQRAAGTAPPRIADKTTGMLSGDRTDPSRYEVMADHPNGRNARTVWTVASEPYPDAHFATFPTELPRRCILAGTSARGCCSACGAPWRRCTTRTFVPMKDRSPEFLPRGAGTQKPMDSSNGWQGFPRGTTETQATGWEPTCRCAAEVVPCRVGDPFLGSGTTAAVAIGLGRDAWGSELQPAYVPLIRARVAAATPWYAAQPSVGGDVTDLPLFRTEGAA